MLLYKLVDSVLQRYRIAQPKVEQEGQVIISRLHELLDDTQPNDPSPFESACEEGGHGNVP